MNGKKYLDYALATLAAIAAPVLTSLVDSHVLSAQLATDIGAVVAAALASYHGGSIITARSAAGVNTQTPPPAAPFPVGPAAAPDPANPLAGIQ